MQSILEAAVSNAFMALLIAVLVAVLTPAIRRPSVLHALWLLVLIKLVTPPLIDVPLPALMSSRDVAINSQALSTPPFSLPLETHELFTPTRQKLPASADVTWPRLTFRTMLAGIWITGSVGWFVLAGLRTARFVVRLQRAERASAFIRQETLRLSRLLSLRRCPDVFVVDACLPPFVWTFFGRAVVVLPSPLLDQLDVSQQKAVLAHELAHLKRRDHWVRWLEVIATGLYWWNPVFWWTQKRIRKYEEYLCDAWVVWCQPGSIKRYAHALVTTVDFLSGDVVAVPAAASGLGSKRHLHRRVDMIVNRKTNRQLSVLARTGILAMGVLVLPLAVRTASGIADTERQPATTNAQESSAAARPSPPVTSQETAITELERLGARIVRDDDKPDGEVVSVRLQGPNITNTAMKHVGALKTLRELSLYQTGVTDDGLEPLRKLKELRLFSFYETPLTNKVLDVLQNNKQMTALYLSGHGIKDSGIERLGTFTELQHLAFTHTSVSKDGLSLFLPKLSKLRELGLPDGIDDDDLRQLVKGLPDLKKIGGGGFTPDGLKHLSERADLEHLTLRGSQFRDVDEASLKSLTAVKRLSLMGPDVNDEVLKRLNGLSNLNWLLLHNVQISDMGLQELKHVPNIQWLQLSTRGGRPMPVTAKGLASLKEMKRLRTLRLVGPQFDDTMAATLKGMPTLKRVWCPNVSNGVLEELKLAMPNTRFAK